MSAGHPWYKRYPSDFIAGTIGMTLEEKGAYSLILDLTYDRGGPIPDDARWLSGVCGCSVRKWSAIREKLILLGKIHEKNGMLANSRAEKEIEISQSIAKVRAENGSKGGRNSREISSGSNKNKHLAKANGSTDGGNLLSYAGALPDTRVQKEENTSASASEFEEFWKLFPKRDGTNPRAPAEVAYSRAIRGGATHAEIIAGAKAYAAAQKREHGDGRSRYTRMASTWLNQRQWGDEQAGPPPAAAKAKPLEEFTDDDWIARLDYCRPRGEWLPALGPLPFAPGCKVPAHLLVDRDRKITMKVLA